MEFWFINICEHPTQSGLFSKIQNYKKKVWHVGIGQGPGVLKDSNSSFVSVFRLVKAVYGCKGIIMANTHHNCIRTRLFDTWTLFILKSIPRTQNIIRNIIDFEPTCATAHMSYKVKMMIIVDCP